MIPRFRGLGFGKLPLKWQLGALMAVFAAGVLCLALAAVAQLRHVAAVSQVGTASHWRLDDTADRALFLIGQAEGAARAAPDADGSRTDPAPLVAALSALRGSVSDLDGANAAAIAAQAALAAETDRMVRRIGLTGLAVLAVSALVWGVVAASVTGRLGRVGRALQRLAAGDLEAALPQDGGQDQLGPMRDALARLRDLLAEKARLEARQADFAAQRQRIVAVVAEALAELSDGVVGQDIVEAFPDEYAPLRRDFNGATRKLGSAVAHIRTGGERIELAGLELAEAVANLARRTELSAVRLEETKAAMTSIHGAAETVDDDAASVRDLARTASDHANRSAAVVSRTVEAMARIEESWKKISGFVEVIDTISFQTNLLALNAGVEAARAGDAGSGFAVVASEVRDLARRASIASSEIGALIFDSESEVHDGAKLVDDTGDCLADISKLVLRIDAMMDGVAQQSQAQRRAVQSVKEALKDLDALTQENAAMAEEASASTIALSTDAEALMEALSAFAVSADLAGAAGAAAGRNQRGPAMPGAGRAEAGAAA